MDAPYLPFIEGGSESVQFWINVEGERVRARVTREALSDKFGCNGDYVDCAISTYLANKLRIDAAALRKYEAGEEITVKTSDL